MKRLFALISIMVFAVVAMAQTTPTEVTPDAYITDAYYKVVTLDTLTNADNDAFVFRLKDSKTMDFTVKLYTDFVSGSSSGTLIAAGSINGVAYTNIDTITIASVTADAMRPIHALLLVFQFLLVPQGPLMAKGTTLPAAP